MTLNNTPQYCYNHPNRETVLRCNRCDRPICNECAVLTPTGYRCKECVRGQQKIYETAQGFDYVLAIVIGGILSYIGSLLASMLGFFTIFLSPVAGVIIAEAVRWAVKKRRSRGLFRVATIAAAVGAVIIPLSVLVSLLSGGGFNLWGLIWSGAYAILVTSTVFYRLTGITLR
jgi:hypothetical protein